MHVEITKLEKVQRERTGSDELEEINAYVDNLPNTLIPEHAASGMTSQFWFKK